MGHKKTKQETQSTQKFDTATSGETSVPDTPDIQAFRGWQPQTDPSIPYGAASAHNRLDQSFNNPLGGFATAAMQDAMKRTGHRQIDQDASQAFRQSAYDVNQQKAGQLGSLAALTRGQKTSGTSSGTGSMQGTGTTTQSGISWGEILGAAAQAGTAAMGIPGVGKNRSTGGGGSPSPYGFGT